MQFKIVSNRLPEAEIVVEKKVNSVELFAAEELQRYIKEVSKAVLPIRKERKGITAECLISIGETDASRKAGIKLGDRETDGFTIKTVNNHIFLAGNNPRATLYAVYYLLETLGCKWYEPGKAGEVIPKAKEITLKDIDITEKPDFDIRGFWLVYLNKDVTISIVDWMAKNRMNWVVCANHFTNYDDCIQPISEEFKKRGMQIELGIHTLTPGTFGLDPKLLKTKPECFALVNGKRGGRLCYTNPEARHLVAKNIVRFCKKRPEIKRVHILFKDGVTGWCECKNCKKIQPHKIDPLWNLPKVSDVYAYFIDNLTTELKGKLPDMQFSMVACYTAREVPENPDILPKNPNVYVVLDHYERCHTHLLTKGKCEKNPTIKKDNLKWRKAYPGKMWIWDMAAGIFDYTIGMVSPLTNIIKDSITFGKRLKVSGMITNWEDSQALPSNQYLYAHLLWNVELNISKMKDDFFEEYYGPAGDIMAEYAREFGEYPHNFRSYSGHRDQRALLAYLSDDKLSRLKKLLKSAMQRAIKKEYKDRLKKATQRLELMELWKKLDDSQNEALKIAGKKGIHKADHIFFTEEEREEREERKKREIDFRKIDQLEKKGKKLALSIIEHNDPANEEISFAVRLRGALMGYNKIRTLCEPSKASKLYNGGFEEGEGCLIPSWEGYEGTGTIDTKVHHFGKKSFHFFNHTFWRHYGIKQTVILKQKKPRAVHFGGWYKTEKVEGNKDSNFCFQVSILTDKKELLSEKISLEPGTHSWKKAEKVIHLDVPIKQITFIILFRRHRGKVWFDDVFLEEI